VKAIVYPPGLTLYPGLGKHWWERVTSEQLVEIAQLVDRLGYDLMLAGEHPVVKPEMVKEFGARYTEALSSGAFLLGATRNVRMICMSVLPLRNPVVHAKTIASIDFMSGGRMIPMVMLGYLPWQYELLGAPPYEERNEVMDEYVEALKELWESDDPRYEGKYVSFADVVFDPKPAQEPFPLWFGGRSNRAIRRIARYGDGWLMQAGARTQVAEWVEYLKAQLARQGRTTPFDLGIDLYDSERNPVTHEVIRQPQIVLDKDAILEQLHAIAAIGATCTRVDDLLGTGKYQNDRPDAPPKTSSYEEYLERLHWFAEEILPGMQRLDGAPLL
jgi:probable F420-dependent oxidoreductase